MHSNPQPAQVGLRGASSRHHSEGRVVHCMGDWEQETGIRIASLLLVGCGGGGQGAQDCLSRCEGS
jgi:hypothetical protein